MDVFCTACDVAGDDVRGVVAPHRYAGAAAAERAADRAAAMALTEIVSGGNGKIMGAWLGRTARTFCYALRLLWQPLPLPVRRAV